MSEKTTDHVVLCVYKRKHGTFYTLGSRVLCGTFVSPTGKPDSEHKISISKLKEIIEHAERTGDPE